MTVFWTILAYLFSILCLIPNLSLFVTFKPPYSFYLVVFQLMAAALAPFLVILGGVGAVLGGLLHAPLALAAGLLGAAISIVYMILVTIRQRGFEKAFGKDWEVRIPPSEKSRLSPRRWQIGLAKTRDPHFEQNIPFWTIPGSDRKLLCDIWQPPDGVERSGLALIYLHGSAWYLFDKDFATRPLFRQLAAQGHVIMDVAYRLCPEVDIYEMVGDAKRAVDWMKSNAGKYGVNPERIVLGGASAGGHLALLAGYAPYHPRLTPAELQGRDLSVRAVISYYGPTDLRACYRHTNQARLVDLPKVEIGLPGSATMKKDMTQAGRLDVLLGGHLGEIPEIYELASPVAHVHPGCPPTLLVQGESDVITPAAATRELHQKLVQCGVAAVNIIYPLTNHAFDLLLPQVSPSSQAALYDLERFLALAV